MFNHHRGLWGYTGAAADGEPLTIQATGMGGPSAAIVLQELIDLGARRVIRVGTCGALAAGLELGSLVIAGEAICADGTSRALGAGDSGRRGRPPSRRRCSARRRMRGLEPVISVDLFYDADLGAADGALAVEMEAAALFALGSRAGIAVGCVLVVSDTFGDGGARERIDDDMLRESAEAMGRAAVGALSEDSSSRRLWAWLCVAAAAAFGVPVRGAARPLWLCAAPAFGFALRRRGDRRFRPRRRSRFRRGFAAAGQPSARRLACPRLARRRRRRRAPGRPAGRASAAGRACRAGRRAGARRGPGGASSSAGGRRSARRVLSSRSTPSSIDSRRWESERMRRVSRSMSAADGRLSAPSATSCAWAAFSRASKALPIAPVNRGLSSSSESALPRRSSALPPRRSRRLLTGWRRRR